MTARAATAAFGRATGSAWTPLAALGAVGAVAAGLVFIGPVVGLAIVGLLGVLLLIRRPGIGLAVLLVTTVALESDPYGFLPITAKYYVGPPSINEVVMATATAGVLLDMGIKRRLPLLPEPFTVPLALLVLAVMAGTVTGHFSNGSFSEVLWVLRPVGYLILVSFLTVNLLRNLRDVKVFGGVAAGLAVYKGVEGCIAWFSGSGRNLDGTAITFYEPTANFVMLLFLVGVASALLQRIPLPLWVKLSTPFVLVSFTLALRRNFWIAGTLAILLTIMLTSGIRGRRLVFPTVLVLIGAVWIALAAGGGAQVQGPLAERARALAPSTVNARKEDVYRLQEIKNVIIEIRNHPIAGLGLGVPWSAVDHPLPEEHPGGRYYTHVAVFWYWIKFGLIGVAAYLWLMAAAVLTAIRVWRFTFDTFLKVVGLAVATSLAGLMVAETTGTFTGADYRFSVIMGALLGWLAAARMHGLSGPRTEP
ncbi:MAG TPA: O-antigen ligase family protein [Gaiellaceae bacterium]|jgi:hypothetical protein|nr:O-antigen ligase family protein [Gaiellaceae bacterium]